MRLSAEAKNLDMRARSQDLVFRSREDVWMGRLKAAERGIDLALSMDLRPRPYFVEGLAYWQRAKLLQNINLGRARKRSCGDDLQDAIPIYDTVERRYAGFSNVLEQLHYGARAPKINSNRERGYDYPMFQGEMEEWLYVCLVHRITGSGASFEKDHGWRNTIVPAMATHNSVKAMAKFAGSLQGPSFTSIGNQIPPFNKLQDGGKYRNAGHEYLAVYAPKLVLKTLKWLDSLEEPTSIQAAVDKILVFQSELGCRQFKFVLTAWAMDIAEYYPELVDPWSDCYHGKNAIESINHCLEPVVKMGKQKFYDRATRLFSNLTGTKPMDVEDASPGCDLVRWLENYVPKKGFQHVLDRKLFNSSSLKFLKGRQPSHA